MATAATMPQGGFMSGDATTNVRESIVPRDVSAALQSFPQERSDATLQLIHDWLLHVSFIHPFCFVWGPNPAGAFSPTCFES